MKKNEEFFATRENLHPESDQIEVYFCDAGFHPLMKSPLNKNTFYFFKEDFSIGNIKNRNTDIKIDPNKKVRIWTSHINIHEYLSFLYFCYKFKENNISVVFTDNYSKDMNSIGTTTSEEIPKLLKYEQQLTNKEIEKYKEEWLHLVKEDGELRIFKDQKVISVDYDYLNDYILKYYNENNIYETIGNLMANDMENNFSYDVYRFLINRIDIK